MTNKKWIYPTINILLYAVGFPILFIISLVKSIQWNSFGMYGASSFAPLIAVIIIALITGGVQALVLYLCKKKNKTGKSLAIKLIVIPIAVIVGLMGLIDMIMPPLLKDATSNTILYEDVVQDYQGTHEKLLARVNLFKSKNGMDDSVNYTDKEFQDVFKPLFASMDKAYYAFDQLAIEMALDQPDLLGSITSGRFPIMLAATLLLKTGSGNDNNHNLTLSELISMNVTKILGIIKEIENNGLDLTPDGLNKIVNSILVSKEFDGIKWNIFNILGSNMIAPDIDPNAKIIKYDEFDNETDMGASLGYQDMAWLNGVPIMFFIPLMSIRNILYLFAALIAIFVFMQMFIAQAYSKKFNTSFSFFMIALPKKAAHAEDNIDMADAAIEDFQDTQNNSASKTKK